MVTRSWLATWLASHLRAAQTAPEMPVIPKSEEMSDELMREWLASEAQWWLAASQKRGLTLQQRSIRIAVSRFYDVRLKSMLDPDSPPGGIGSWGP